PGGTDSRHYAAITKDTYRFVPYELDTEDMERIHGRNERLSISAFAKAVQVYAELMREAGQ
ncbi:MAG TPA: M20/M25/M40 family metallo-hydrolase, partial [Hellea balneolensis]|nr:M20/M25/M40 family metallo-hydrolase [Hellea balneolensis]